MIYIHVALPAEAEPLIAHYRLAGDAGAPVDRTWRNDNLCLIISGLGKLNAATAVALTDRRPTEMENPGSAWINVGTAWHTHRPTGDVCLAHSITDGGSGRCWYPQIVFPAPCPEAPLITEDRPADNYADDDYPEGALHDMEAAGFCAAALKFTHLERVHCLKVVSDNRAQPLSADRAAKRAPDLMATCLPVLDKLIRHMHELNDAVAQRTTLPRNHQHLTHNRYTTNERRQLMELLRQWQRHMPDEPLPWQEFSALPVPHLLSRLRSRLHEAVVNRQP